MTPPDHLFALCAAAEKENGSPVFAPGKLREVMEEVHWAGQRMFQDIDLGGAIEEALDTGLAATQPDMSCHMHITDQQRVGGLGWILRNHWRCPIKLHCFTAPPADLPAGPLAFYITEEHADPLFRGGTLLDDLVLHTDRPTSTNGEVTADVVGQYARLLGFRALLGSSEGRGWGLPVIIACSVAPDARQANLLAAEAQVRGVSPASLLLGGLERATAGTT